MSHKVWLSLTLTVFVLLLSSCRPYITATPGMVALEKAPILLTGAGGITEGRWQAKELFIDYRMSLQGDGYDFSGKLTMDRSVTDSFPFVDNLIVKLNFLDEQGQVLSVVDITPFLPRRSMMPERINLKANGQLPVGCKAMVFNYLGSFREVSREFGTEQWDVFHFPFIR